MYKTLFKTQTVLCIRVRTRHHTLLDNPVQIVTCDWLHFILDNTTRREFLNENRIFQKLIKIFNDFFPTCFQILNSKFFF